MQMYLFTFSLNLHFLFHINSENNKNNRNASSVKSNRGRKPQENENVYNQQIFENVINREHKSSAYINEQSNNFKMNFNPHVNNTISYYKEAKPLPRSKSNNRKKGALILNNRSNI